MDNKYENIVPWNGAQDTGRDVRLKLDRNFDRIKTNFEELLNELKKKLSNSEPDEAAEVIAFLKGLKVSDSLISRLLLRDTEVDELLDTDIMSALRVMAEIYENNDNLEKLFLSKVKKDRAAEHITFEKGGTAENGFIVRLPKQNAPAALMSCLLEEDIDTFVEEDEDAIVEVAPAEASGDLTLGGLLNTDPSWDTLPNDVYSLEMRDGTFYPKQGGSRDTIMFLTFGIEDGCLMMNHSSDESNIDFSIDEVSGMFQFDLKI